MPARDGAVASEMEEGPNPTGVRHRSEFDTSAAAAKPPWRQYLQALGPGLVTGASDDDPSGIATYAQAGSQFRYGMLWTSLVTFPLMAAIQEICDRTALASGKGLGELITQRFGGRTRLVIGALLAALCLANVANMAADLVAIGEGMHLLHLGPTTLWALVAGTAITALLLSGSFATIAHIFKLLCLSLLSYIVVLAFAHVPWNDVIANTLIPHITWSAAYLALLIGVLGTTISPYLFFWQSAHRIEELRNEPAGGTRAVPLPKRKPGDAAAKIRTSRADVITGMALSNLVMFAIIVATGSTLGAHGANDINSAAEAAQALQPVAGSAATVLFAVGFIASGVLAVPVLAGSGSAGMAGLLHKRWGFSRSPRRAPVFYTLVAAATLTATILSLLHVDPIRLLILVAVINGVIAAPFLLVVMLIATDPTIMGRHHNRRLTLTLGWITLAVMAAAAAAFFTITYA